MQHAALFSQMIALQEELDWHVYRLYGLIEDDLTYPAKPPQIHLGERTFEIHLARRMAAGETESTWFERHSSTPITDIPRHWPADYQALIQRRLNAIASNQWIRLIEQPEYKRRWNRDPWEKRLHAACKEWLLDQLEQLSQHGELQTSAQLADRTRQNNKFQEICALYTGTDTFDLQSLIAELISNDNLPQMAAARYKPAAMPKFRAWQDTWAKQRREDAIDAEYGVDKPLPAEQANDPEAVRKYQQAKAKADAKKAAEIGTIPVPPQYASTDFRQASYWPLRGKLDVPKERFFSLPGCEKDGDSTLVIGWAGFNHLQRAKAIAAWCIARKEEDGWEADKLTPMLVALDELIPWLKQWHNDMDPEYGERMGDFYEGSF